MMLFRITFMIAVNLLMFCIFSPCGAVEAIPWEKNELIGAEITLKTTNTVESIFVKGFEKWVSSSGVILPAMNCSYTTGTIGKSGEIESVAPCIYYCNLDSSGALVLTDGRNETINFIKVRSIDSTIKGLFVRVSTVEVLRNGQPAVCTINKYMLYPIRNYLVFIIFLVPALIVVIVIVVIRRRRYLKKKEDIQNLSVV